MIAFDPAELASGIPAHLHGLGFDAEAEPLVEGGFRLGEEIAVLRAEEHDLVTWRRARALLDELRRARERYDAVVLLVERMDSRRLAELRRGSLARAICLGVTVLPVADAREAARWIGLLADEHARTSAVAV